MLLISDAFKGNKEDLDYLVELGKELKTQDNLGTRKPLLFRIQDIEIVECAAGVEDFKKMSFSFGDVDTMMFDEGQIDKAKTFIKSNYENIFDDDNEALDNLNECTDLEEMIDFCFQYDVDMETRYFTKELRYTGEFLTRKAAKKHLERFRYRYSDEARIYCSCAVENEEITKLTEVLERIYEMNCKEEL